MATKKKTSTTAAKEDFQKAYIRLVLTTGKPTVFALCESLGEEEASFYNHFSSTNQLEAEMWNDSFNRTWATLEDDTAFASYSSREKLLAFYFLWMEELKKNRSFFQWSFQQKDFPNPEPKALKPLRELFVQRAKLVVAEGQSQGEIAERGMLSDRYAHLLWMQGIFVLKFWLDDSSSHFERTDAAIEKSVNLAFDLMSKGALDSMLDFGKFLFQQA